MGNDYTLTDEQKKDLTFWLGECWHIVSHTGHCKKCKEFQGRGDGNRDFTTPLDMGGLVRKMVERGVMAYFLDYTYRKIAREVEQVRRGARGQQVTEIDGPIYMIWGQYLLVNPERFCQLVHSSEVWRMG